MASQASRHGGPRSTYKPTPRFVHVSAQVGHGILVYSGLDKHSSSEMKQHLASFVELFDPYREEWTLKKTTGESPMPEVWTAASASVHDCLYMYGGADFRGDNVMSAFHRLDTKTYHWSKLTPQNAQDQSPMAKGGAEMVACGDKLALFGGKGLPHGPPQPGSTYTEESSGSVYTNEFHIYHLKEGVWSSPATTGERPPPCAAFSFTSLDNRRAVVFGGISGEKVMMNDVYIIDMQTMHWTKLSKPGGEPWPEEGYCHAACCLNYDQQHPQLLVTGGLNSQGELLGAWILDVVNVRWRKLSDSIQPRAGHTANAIRMGPGLTEVILHGGMENTDTDADAETTILQFKLEGHSWELSGVIGQEEMGQSEERLREKLQTLNDSAQKDDSDI